VTNFKGNAVRMILCSFLATSFAGAAFPAGWFKAAEAVLGEMMETSEPAAGLMAALNRHSGRR
jgi:hypothetical protein